MGGFCTPLTYSSCSPVFLALGRKADLRLWAQAAFQKQSKSNFHSMTSFEAGLHHEEKRHLFICNNFKIFMGPPQQDVI